MTALESIVDMADGETPDMKTTQTADANFLRRILFTLIIATVATGALASYAAVSAGQLDGSQPVEVTSASN